MHLTSALAGGLIGAAILDTLLQSSQRLRISRINIPYLLGTIVSVNRDRAKLIGMLLHFVVSVLIAFLYALGFHALGRSDWWLGAIFGLIHAAFLLAVVLPVFPSFHPHMASEHQPPTHLRQLEPPGFMGLHYGLNTPFSILLSHIIFGIVIAIIYRGI
jgi:uncharacterized membrane protein YagU involved in acid resistance